MLGGGGVGDCDGGGYCDIGGSGGGGGGDGSGRPPQTKCLIRSWLPAAQYTIM